MVTTMKKRLPSFEELQKPLPAYSLNNIYYHALRLLLKTAGNLSDGIRIGNTFGYDSGVMLDYVYKNKASGKLGIGALFDRIYLNVSHQMEEEGIFGVVEAVKI